MLFLILAINNNVIEIYKNKLSNKLLKYVIHEMHKDARSIREANMHCHPFIETISSFEIYFLFITWSHVNQVITTTRSILENIVVPSNWLSKLSSQGIRKQ